MLKNCNILYTSANKKTLLSAITRFLLLSEGLPDKDVEILLDYFKKKLSKSNTPIKTTVDNDASSEANDANMNLLIADFNEIISTKYKLEPKQAPLLRKLIESVKELGIVLDNTQLGSNTIEDDDFRTYREAADKNTVSLENHIKEIYGLSAYDIQKELYAQFDDDTSAASYWDINTGNIVPRSNTILNLNFEKLKESYFLEIVDYLKIRTPDLPILNLLPKTMFNRNTFNSELYTKILFAFYKALKLNKNYREELILDSIARMNQLDRAKHTEYYITMMSALMNNESFKLAIDSKRFSLARLTNLASVLYEADHYSLNLELVISIVNKYKLENLIVNNNETVGDFIKKIKAKPVNLLTTVNAYTCLTHFDELLKAIHGKSFTIKKAYSNIEIGPSDKYSYSIDTDHLKQIWQESESVNSELYTTNMTKRIFNQIRVYDYKTQIYQFRRVDSTAFIIAARNLINDLLYGNIRYSYIPDLHTASFDKFKEFENNFVSLHNNPEDNFLKILEYLFEGSKPLYKKIISTKLLTNYDLNVLYSVYLAVYNKNNPNSLIRKEMEAVKQSTGVVQTLVLEISGYVDRNTTMDYLETYYDDATGAMKMRIKKKYTNNLLAYKFRININNRTNSFSQHKLRQLENTYKFTETSRSLNHYYTVNLDEIVLGLTIPNKVPGAILSNSDSISLKAYTADGLEIKDIFKKIESLDLVEFEEKLRFGKDLTDEETILYKMLQFIDDYLEIGFLLDKQLGRQLLETYRAIYLPSTDKIVGKYSIMPLLQLGMRAAYVVHLHKNAEDNNQTLAEYLDSTNDNLYKMYERNKTTSRLFSCLFNITKYTTVNNKDLVLDTLADAYSILTGDASKATTKDRQGNSIPNNSVNKLGTNVHHYLAKQKDTNVASLLFVDKSRLIKATYHDLEVTTQNGDNKPIKQFSNGELFYHAIFNKFWGNYLLENSDQTVVILPTVFSDKTTFINYGVSTNIDGVDLMTVDNYEDEVVQLYLDTIGNSYKKIWETKLNKLLQITSLYNAEHLTNFSIKEFMAHMSGEQLVDFAYKHGYTLSSDSDFRIVKDKNGKEFTAVNEILQYYAETLYANLDNLKKALKKQLQYFIENLLEAGSSFLVIEYNDKLSYYLDKVISPKAAEHNLVLRTILKVFENKAEKRKKYLTNWVDERTGRLIIAKQNDTNIVGISNNFDKNEDFELNPLLKRFFYVESLFSNNLRMSLTGNETNHPDKAKKTLFKKLLKTKNIEDYLALLKANIDSNIDLPLAEQVKNILDNINYVGYLTPDAVKNMEVSSKIAHILNLIYEQSVLSISNTAQGTQFKRNVIIPATLQYIQLNVRLGVPPKVKCAVIRDEQAHVWNYKGDHEGDIDAADGSALITAFLSIMENKALGSLAVGFTKKPIWHSFDPEEGTAFLAKFATDTITNEAMRMSLNSHTSLFNLFRKMTNLQWQEGIDLTRSISFGKRLGGTVETLVELERWFQSDILGNTSIKDANGNSQTISDNHLIYRNALGEDTEIVSFNVTRIKEGNIKLIYYTKEKPYISDTGILNIEDNSNVVKVYHIFDTVNGEIVHLTFDTYQKALDYVNQHEGAHTINSLFELHTALGSINCVNTKGEYSEFNNEVVVNFMNSVGTIKEDTDASQDLINLENYDQPLKLYHIGYALNNTAVKNGAKNINPESSWWDNTELRYFEVDSDGLGMQMNADHDIVNSELTEFSQVVTATSAYGFTHENCNEIFYSLAAAAVEASYESIQAVEQFLKSQFKPEDRLKALSDLYDVIGRIILASNQIKDKESLDGIILEGIANIFSKYNNHEQDDFKIPFSDPNIYSTFIASLASTITRESIKRKHPGSGCVMVPAYNTILYFEFDNMKYTANDIIRLALEDYRKDLIELCKQIESFDETNLSILDDKGLTIYLNNSIKKLEEVLNEHHIKNTSKYRILQGEESLANIDSLADTYSTNMDATTFNKFLIQTFLKAYQVKQPIMNDASFFMPSDIANVYYGDSVKPVEYRLDSLDKYYRLTDGIYALEHKYDVNILTDYATSTYRISLKENPNILAVIKPEISKDEHNFTGKYEISFINSTLEQFLIRLQLEKEEEIRLLNAAAGTLPIGALLVLNPVDDNDFLYFLNLSNCVTASFNIDIETNTLTKTSNNIPEARYQVNVTQPHNLRPSLIRWQYNKISDNTRSYMNIFDTKAIKGAYIERFNIDKLKYRSNILDVLHNLYKGTFIDPEGFENHVIEGSLENSAAELVMSNIYQEKFHIKPGESLNNILSLGEQYFLNKIRRYQTPKHRNYDIVFTTDSGRDTYISISPVHINSNVRENPFDLRNLKVNKDDEVHLMKGNKKLFKIGKWIKDTSVEYRDGHFYKNGKIVEDETKYRLKNKLEVLVLLEYVKPFIAIIKDLRGFKKVPLYQIADIEIFKLGISNTSNDVDTDARKQRSSIINAIFKIDNYKLARVSTVKSYTAAQVRVLNSCVGSILADKYVDEDMKDMLRYLLKSIQVWDKDASNKIVTELETALDNGLIEDFKNLFMQRFLNNNLSEEILNILNNLPSNVAEIDKNIRSKISLEIKKLTNIAQFLLNLQYNALLSKKALETLLKKQAHKQWVSFLDSLNFISSRIPAQTLQSFMTMKLIAWTENSKNMAYVSHFQTYLQGSDYDIDKAYIMGLSYDENAVYIKWSNLFDYTSAETLAASKQLPLPRKEYPITFISNLDPNYKFEYNLSKDIDRWMALTDDDGNIINEEDRVKILHIYADLLHKINNNHGYINYFTTNEELNRKLKILISILNKHLEYIIPVKIAEAAYKNVASANIYAVAHDIRNRDLAYTAIAMNIMQKAADNSPKGESAANLNMLNPLTKYVMQYQNLVGKNVISIAANGEKLWFNAYYFWHQVLLHGDEKDIKRLQFAQTFDRIKNRALKDGKIESYRFNCLPDLNIRDMKIKTALMEFFDIDTESYYYKEVDLLISQLLSAATDNAKELILDKINANTNFARMYIYAMMAGFNIDDIVAFMTCPVAGFIDLMSKANMFQLDSVNNNATQSINLALGIIGVNKFLHGKIKEYYIDINGDNASKSVSKKTYVFDNLEQKIPKDMLQTMRQLLNIDKDKNFMGISEFMKAYIQCAVTNSDWADIKLDSFFQTNDIEINTYIDYCQNIIDKLKDVYAKYKGDKEAFFDDIKEFNKLYLLSAEISTIASAYLGNNQGIPTDKLGLLKRLLGMSKIVVSREKYLGIDALQMYGKATNKEEATSKEQSEETDESEEVEEVEEFEESEETIKELSGDTTEEYLNRVIKNIEDNNPYVDNIKQRLLNAYNAKIMNNFDITRYLIDDDYKEKVKDYYGLIMGTFNIFDMMDTIPTYKSIMRCLRVVVVADNTFPIKSRLIRTIIKKEDLDNVSDEQLRGMIEYADKKMVSKFAETLSPLHLPSFSGFDAYFADAETQVIDFNTIHGITSFRKWVEKYLYDELKNSEDLKDNGFIQNMILVPDGQLSILATKIDLMNPDLTTLSRERYDAILRGMHDLENYKLDTLYKNKIKTDYSIADILQLYNILVNDNKYGAERLTTAFKGCKSKKNILYRYLAFVGNRDYGYTKDEDDQWVYDGEIDYDYLDYKLNAAPHVRPSTERYHNELFVLENDPVLGTILKKYNAKYNIYEPHSLIPPSLAEDDNPDKRMLNFAEYCPLKMPNYYKHLHILEVLTFEGEFKDLDETMLKNVSKELINILKTMSTSSKILIYKLCE